MHVLLQILSHLVHGDFKEAGPQLRFLQGCHIQMQMQDPFRIRRHQRTLQRSRGEGSAEKRETGEEWKEYSFRKIEWSRLITTTPGKVTKTFPELEIHTPQTCQDQAANWSGPAGLPPSCRVDIHSTARWFRGRFLHGGHYMMMSQPSRLCLTRREARPSSALQKKSVPLAGHALFKRPDLRRSRGAWKDRICRERQRGRDRRHPG